MPERSSPPDLAERRTAAREFDRNLVVSAGAGSGKTTLLVERLLNLCLGRGVPLSRVAALTFTEKAAAEMRDRLASAFSELITTLGGGSDAPSHSVRESLEWLRGLPDLTDAELRDRALAGLRDLDGGVIGTIHSFCGDLLRRHPHAARLDPAFVVDDGVRIEKIFEDEWRHFLADELAEDSPRGEGWLDVLSQVDLASVEDVARALLWTARPAAEADRVHAALADVVRACTAELTVVEELGGNPRFVEQVVGCRSLLAAFIEKGSIAEVGIEEKHARLREELAKADLEELLERKRSAGAKNRDPGRADAALKAARRLLKGLHAVDSDLIARVVEIAGRAAQAVRQRLEVEGVVGFDGLLVGAHDVLRDSATVRRREQGRFAALLLDEFQDTDPLQYEIAFLLAEKRDGAAREGLDPWDLPLEPGSLFIVGDPKQSIYRFRGADVASYERAVEVIRRDGGELLSLTANFRSREEILAPINALCEEVFVGQPPYQPAYEPIAAAREDASAGETRVEVWTVEHDGRRAEDNRDAEARVLAAAVAEWSRTGVIASHGDVTLLFRAMTDVYHYQRAFAEAGVPYITQGGKGFVDRDEVVQAVNMLRCLVTPNDRAALLAVLRSPSCGADDRELARFAALMRTVPGLRFSFRSHARIPDDAVDDLPNIARTLRGLASLARRVALAPADVALRAILADALASSPGDGAWRPRFIELSAASHDGAQRLANLEKLIGRAAELSRAEGLSLVRVAERLHAEVSRRVDEGESPLADEAIDAVRLMTVHQAKGLEFPVVVVPDVARKPGRPPIEGADVKLRGDVASVVLPRGARNLASVLVEQEEERHEDAERARLLYVALTRARERLVVVNGNARPGSDSWPCPAFAAGWSYDPSGADGEIAPGVMHRRVRPGEIDAPPGESVDVQSVADAVLAHDAAREKLQLARVGRALAATDTKHERERRRLEVELQPAEAGVAEGATEGERPDVTEELDPLVPARMADASLAPLVGNAVHRALELWDFEDGARLEELAHRSARLETEGLSGEQADLLFDEVLGMVRGLAVSDLPQRLRAARVLARELPFTYPDEAAPQGRLGYVDLVLEEDGCTWAVDWKTDRARHPEKHRAQLEVYGEAVRRWRGLSGRPGLALIYVSDGAWATLSEPE